MACMCISGIPQQFEHDVLAALDILRGLPSFGFRSPETDEAIPEIVFDSEMAFAVYFMNELLKGTLLHCAILRYR